MASEEANAPSETGLSSFSPSIPNLDAELGNARVLKVRSLAELARPAPPPREWLVEGLIPLGCVTFISGDGGLGKTLLGQQLLMSAALGIPWLDRPVRQVKSVALFCEDDPAEIYRRGLAIAAHHGIAPDDPRLGGVKFLCEVGENNALAVPWAPGDASRKTETTELHDELRKLALKGGRRLVLLDSLHDIYAGNENYRPEARAFVGALTRLSQEIDGAVVVLAQPSIAGLERGSGTSGSTAWNNAVRSRLYLMRVEPPPGRPGAGTLRVLRTVKANYGRAGEDIRLRWRDGVFVTEPPSGAPVRLPRRRRW